MDTSNRESSMSEIAVFQQPTVLTKWCDTQKLTTVGWFCSFRLIQRWILTACLFWAKPLTTGRPGHRPWTRFRIGQVQHPSPRGPSPPRMLEGYRAESASWTRGMSVNFYRAGNGMDLVFPTGTTRFNSSSQLKTTLIWAGAISPASAPLTMRKR